jgi:hypothetical protein
MSWIQAILGDEACDVLQRTCGRVFTVFSKHSMKYDPLQPDS